MLAQILLVPFIFHYYVISITLHCITCFIMGICLSEAIHHYKYEIKETFRNYTALIVINLIIDIIHNYIHYNIYG